MADYKYLDKIKHNSIKKHTQTHIWEKAYKSQLNLEKVLGKKFSPSDYAIYLSNNTVNHIIQQRKENSNA